MAKSKYKKRQERQEVSEGVDKYEGRKEEKQDRPSAPRNHIVKYIKSLEARNLPKGVIDQANKQPTKNAAQRVIKKYREQAGL